MNNEMISTYVAFLVFGLLASLTKEKYLHNLIVSSNKIRIFKLEPKITIRLMKIFGIGFLIIGVLGIFSFVLKWNTY